MRIRTLCSGVLAVSLSGVCAADGLPNTMNFENVTSTRLNQITST